MVKRDDRVPTSHCTLMNIASPVDGLESCWRPLVDGDAGAALRHTAGSIAGQAIVALSAPERASRAGSLAGGLAGAALAEWFVRRDHGEAVRLTNRAWEAAAARPDRSLFSGMAGAGWLAEVIAREGGEGGASPELTQDLARLLEEEVPSWTGHYDLVSGLVGLGVFALERAEAYGDRALLDLVVRHLLGRRRRGAHEGTWFTDPRLMPPHQVRMAPHGQTDLGVAHGVPGALAFLAMVRRRDGASDEIDGVLRSGVTWLLARAGEHPGRRYPAVIAEPEREGRGVGSRVAWCYGDLSVAAGLAQVATALGEAEWSRRAAELAREAFARDCPENGVVEGNVCHGVAGNALVGAFIAALTGDAGLRVAAQRHLSLLGKFAVPETNPPLFKSRKPTPSDGPIEWEVDHGMLTGGLGIALVARALTEQRFPRWCRFLLLDDRMLQGSR